MKFTAIICMMCTSLIICDDKDTKQSSKHPMLFFRKQVEEVEESTVENREKDDSPNNLVLFLIKNVRKIYDDLSTSEKIEELESITDSTTRSTSLIKLSNIHVDSSEEDKSTTCFLTNDVKEFENLTITNLIDDNLHEHDEGLYGVTGRSQMLHLSKYLEKMDKSMDSFPAHLNKSTKTIKQDTVEDNEILEQRLSCIVCDNVNSEDCNDPKNKLMSSIICERDDDLCYSQHTPFGIVDRGCFNINHNLTTYVCACNLCNYVSLSEMPYIFSNKRDWVDNVIELSRTKHFRKSVFKDMSCLRCETNVTTKSRDMLESTNCLEGNIGSLPVEECNENEICAVQVVRSHGYVWRGCVKTPLYNYWWALCDSDLCNYDPLISIYDHL